MRSTPTLCQRAQGFETHPAPRLCQVGVVIYIKRLKLRDLKQLAQGRTTELRLELSLLDSACLHPHIPYDPVGDGQGGPRH